MSRPPDPELPSLFERAVDAALSGQRGFRSGAVVFNVYYCAGLAYDVMEPLPQNISGVLRLPRNSTYHDGARRLKALLRRTAPGGAAGATA